MSLALTLACVWVVASAIVAMLPMRFQYVPGVALLIAALPLLGYVGYIHGWIWAAVILAAVISMFRNPLRYFWRTARGRAA